MVVPAWASPVANRDSRSQNKTKEVLCGGVPGKEFMGFLTGASAASPRYFFVPVVGLEEGR